METTVNDIRCHFCGGADFDERLVEYVYRRRGSYLMVQDVPCDVCLRCGERYYAGATLLRIEQRFNAIYEQHAKPQRTVQVPVEAYA